MYHQETSFHCLQKVQENTVPKTMAINLPQILHKNSNITKIRVTSYTHYKLDTYNVETRTTSFQDQ